ncbi:MAG: Tat pathway signal protein [Ideonella sp. MAG2]|nr:MAG: Tat pathway signal protein [Ideonella sp. MAG2]
MTMSPSRRAFLGHAARFAAFGAAAPLGLNLAAITAASAATLPNDYRALVCIFLYGGNDSYNTLAPANPEHHQAYAAARGSLALPLEALQPYALSLARPLPDGQTLALNPRLNSLHAVHQRGELALTLRVGTLQRPVTREDYFARRNLPPKLMSHNDQFSLWQSLVAEGANSGWGGRIADMLAASAGQQQSLFNTMSVDSGAVYSVGQHTQEFVVTSAGPIRVAAVPGVPSAQAAMVASLTRPSPHLMRRELAQRTLTAQAGATQLESALSGVPLGFEFPASPLGEQLNMVTRLIAAHSQLGLKRQCFFVSLGGFDLHSDADLLHGDLLQQLAEAMTHFQDLLNYHGLGQQVLTFTASDFGRALTPNGSGTDHGWGGHHLLMGQAVSPRQWAGESCSYTMGAADDIGQGRMLPSVSVDQFGATLATWMGVPSSDLSTIFPNIGEFNQPTLDLLRAS